MWKDLSRATALVSLVQPSQADSHREAGWRNSFKRKTSWSADFVASPAYPDVCLDNTSKAICRCLLLIHYTCTSICNNGISLDSFKIFQVFPSTVPAPRLCFSAHRLRARTCYARCRGLTLRKRDLWTQGGEIGRSCRSLVKHPLSKTSLFFKGVIQGTSS